MQPPAPNATRPAHASSGPARRLRVLHLEDSPLDHELTLAHLARGGLPAEVRRIDSEAEFLGALDERDWDAIISDYNLPGFSGLVALDLLKASGRDVPFILVSGEIGEDTAVEAMRNGASDYLLKNNLARLVPALLHAVEATETRRARVRADRELDESKTPIMLAAPGRFSTTTLRPHISVKPLATPRVRMSAEPPAAKGTMMVTFFAG